MKVGSRRERFRYDGWPIARRLRFALNCGLAAAVALGLFWSAWWLAGWGVPATVAVDLWPSDGVTALPFAVSRALDVPAALAWGFLLSLLATSPSLRRVLMGEEFARGELAVVLAGGLAGGLAVGLAVGLAGGLAHCGLTVTLPIALVAVPALLVIFYLVASRLPQRS